MNDVFMGMFIVVMANTLGYLKFLEFRIRELEKLINKLKE